MKLIVKLKLLPDDQQRASLLQTLEQANALCDWLSERALELSLFRRFDLQAATYHAARERSGLSAQVVIRCLAKVADAYKLDQATQRTFRSRGAIAYDDRILSWYTDKQAVSIWTVAGRQYVPYTAGERQHELLCCRQGESDLVYRKGEFYLLAVCDIPDPEERDVEEALGVDLGVTNIATTSDGEVMSSEATEKNRQRMAQLRRGLQKRGSLSAKRHLRKLAGKQRWFQTDVNHKISKRLVLEAKRTNRGIALEDLTHIRSRTRVKGSENRARHSNWAFGQLRAFIQYKAKLHGVKVWIVDPRYTSQRCFACGHIAKANRKTQDQFLCVRCGHTNHADVNGAKNTAWLAEQIQATQVQAAVVQPIVSDAATPQCQRQATRL